MANAQRYDAIIIGAGHNGLTTACYLAKAGLRVLVVEGNDWIGGATTSLSRYDDWIYSNCSYVCSLLRPEVVRDLELPRFGLQVVPYEAGATFTGDGGYFAYYGDHHALRREIQRLSPRDAEGYDRFSRAIIRQCRFIRPLLLRTPPDPVSLQPRDVAELLFLLRRFHDLGAAEMAETIRFWTMSVADYVSEFIESEVIRAHFCGTGIIGTGLGVYSPGTAYVLLHHYMGDVDGAIGAWGFTRGGMGSVAKALSLALAEAGGTIVTGSPVMKVLTRNGQASGVVLANGTQYDAPVIASNADVKRTMLGAVGPEALPGDYVQAVRNFKIRGSSGKINVALDGMPRFTGAPADAVFLKGDLHVSCSLAELEQGYDDWKAGHYSRLPYMDMLIPTQLDPTMAPAGKHMMTLFIQYAPYDLELEGRRDPLNWDGPAREAFRETVFDRIEAVAPGFRSLVLHAETRTPLDIERETGLTEGNIFQGELTFDQLLFNRPVPGYAQYRTPIRGLYLVGSSTHPGGGVMAAPGANAAREILRDTGRIGRHRWARAG